MKTYDTITDLIGSTPLLKLNRFAAAENLGSETVELEQGSGADQVGNGIISLHNGKLLLL